MLKKLFVTAAAAAAVSVPLAGLASAEAGGVPGEIGVTPGSVVSQVAHLPGSVPDAVSDLTDGAFRTPGGAVKTFTPGAGHGNGPQ
jgi:hypothetical protein